MKIDKKTIEHVARLARLELDEAQGERFAAQLNVVLEHMEQLNRLDTRDAEPTAHALGVSNVWRPDRPQPADPQTCERILANAPQRLGRFFKVQKVLE